MPFTPSNTMIATAEEHVDDWVTVDNASDIDSDDTASTISIPSSDSGPEDEALVYTESDMNKLEEEFQELQVAKQELEVEKDQLFQANIKLVMENKALTGDTEVSVENVDNELTKSSIKLIMEIMKVLRQHEAMKEDHEELIVMSEKLVEESKELIEENQRLEARLDSDALVLETTRLENRLATEMARGQGLKRALRRQGEGRPREEHVMRARRRFREKAEPETLCEAVVVLVVGLVLCAILAGLGHVASELYDYLTLQ